MKAHLWEQARNIEDVLDEQEVPVGKTKWFIYFAGDDHDRTYYDSRREAEAVVKEMGWEAVASVEEAIVYGEVR